MSGVGANRHPERDERGEAENRAAGQASKGVLHGWVDDGAPAEVRRPTPSTQSGRGVRLTRLCSRSSSTPSYSLIIKTSTDLPPDVRAAVKSAPRHGRGQAPAPPRRSTIIAQNIDQAGGRRRRHLPGHRHADLRGQDAGRRQPDLDEAADPAAVAEATRRGKLRPNSVDSLTGENTGNNLGPGTPIIHFEQWERDDIEVKLMLKGGGCENMNAQYSLPIGAARISAAPIARSKACASASCTRSGRRRARAARRAPIGVCIGGDRTSGYVEAKQQLFRTLDDVNADPRLAELEAEIMRTVNTLGVGTMGFGGKRVADRLQGRRAESAARQLLRVGRLRLLGVSPPRRRARRRRPARSRSGSIAIRQCRRCR